MKSFIIATQKSARKPKKDLNSICNRTTKFQKIGNPELIKRKKNKKEERGEA